MATRVGTQTLGGAVAHITARLKEYTKKTVPPQLWTEIINAKVSMVHEAMGLKDKAIYKDSAILATPAIVGGMVSGSLSNATYTTATRTIYIPTGIWGSYFSGLADATALPIGTTVIIRDDRGGQTAHLSRVESITNATSFVIEDDYGSNLSAGAFGIAIILGTSADSILISGLEYYKRIDKILSIYDSGIADECIDVGNISEYRGIIKRNLAYNYTDQIIWCREGEYLYFAKGSNVSSYGTRTMYYSRKPYDVSADTDVIDLPNHQLDLLYKLCMLDGLQTIQVPIPDELKSAEAQISVMKNESEKELQALLINRKDGN